jgi:hypothetical protein
LKAQSLFNGSFLVVDSKKYFRLEFWFLLKSVEPVDLLFDVIELSIAESGDNRVKKKSFSEL